MKLDVGITLVDRMTGEVFIVTGKGQKYVFLKNEAGTKNLMSTVGSILDRFLRPEEGKAVSS